MADSPPSGHIDENLHASKLSGEKDCNVTVDKPFLEDMPVSRHGASEGRPLCEKNPPSTASAGLSRYDKSFVYFMRGLLISYCLLALFKFPDYIKHFSENPIPNVTVLWPSYCFLSIAVIKSRQCGCRGLAIMIVTLMEVGQWTTVGFEMYYAVTEQSLATGVIALFLLASNCYTAVAVLRGATWIQTKDYWGQAALDAWSLPPEEFCSKYGDTGPLASTANSK